MEAIYQLRIKRARMQSKQYAGGNMPEPRQWRMILPWNPVNNWGINIRTRPEWKWKIWFYSYQYFTYPIRHRLWEFIRRFFINNIFIFKYYFIKET